MTGSFAERIRQAARELGAGGARFSSDDLSDQAGLQTYEDKRRMHRSLRDLMRSGEVERPDRGVYTYAGKKGQKPQKQLIMWRFLRIERTVTVEDLMAAADVSRDYAMEWLKVLVDREIVRDHKNGKFQLIKDPVVMPRNEGKALKLREIRRRKKLALEALRAAKDSIATAENLLIAVDLWEDGNGTKAAHRK